MKYILKTGGRKGRWDCGARRNKHGLSTLSCILSDPPVCASPLLALFFTDEMASPLFPQCNQQRNKSQVFFSFRECGLRSGSHWNKSASPHECLFPSSWAIPLQRKYQQVPHFSWFRFLTDHSHGQNWLLWDSRLGWQSQKGLFPSLLRWKLIELKITSSTHPLFSFFFLNMKNHSSGDKMACSSRSLVHIMH